MFPVLYLAAHSAHPVPITSALSFEGRHNAVPAIGPSVMGYAKIAQRERREAEPKASVDMAQGPIGR
jgi:hypothetical protein